MNRGFFLQSLRLNGRRGAKPRMDSLAWTGGTSTNSISRTAGRTFDRPFRIASALMLVPKICRGTQD